MNGVIYKITSPSGRSYIGQTLNFRKRMSDHNNCVSNSIFHKTVKKYGMENFTIEKIHSGVESKSKLNELETLEIVRNNTIYPNGYNMNLGGDSRLATEEAKRNMSLAHKGKPAEWKRKRVKCIETGIWYDSIYIAEEELDLPRGGLSNSLNCKTKSVRGLHFVTEGNEYDISDVINKSTKPQSIRCCETGEVFNSLVDAARNFRPKAPNGRNIKIVLNNPNKTAYGVHWVSANNVSSNTNGGRWGLLKKQVVQVETGRVFDSLTDAANHCGLRSNTSIYHAINKNKKAGGFHWKYHVDAMESS